MTTHAILSPSSAHRWLRCPGSVALSAQLPEAPPSIHSAEGTFCHDIAAACLGAGMDATELVGATGGVNGYQFTLDADTAEEIQTYIDAVRTFAAGGTIHVEQRVDISHLTGEEGAGGTADALVLIDTPMGAELQVHDLKMGRGVEVEAEGNEQLKLYALGALRSLPGADAAHTVRLFIHQPRISRDPKVAVVSRAELQLFAVSIKAALAGDRAALVPGEKQCRFCPAKASCPALAEWVQETVGASFEVLKECNVSPPVDLSAAMRAVDAIEKWCDAVRAEVERRLLDGQPVDGFKLVMGRRGARKWANEEQAAQLLTAVLGEAPYKQTLFSVTEAEKLVKKVAPDAWERVVPAVTQSPGSPSVAPEADPRPAYSNEGVAAAFSTVS